MRLTSALFGATRHARAQPIATAMSLAAMALLLLVGVARAAGPPFPNPVPNQNVYDDPGALNASTVATLQREIDDIQRRTQAQIVVFVQVDPSATEESNLSAAHALMDQWGVGRSGFDDGLVILLGLQPDLRHGKVSLYAGSGFKSAYLSEDDLASVISDDFVPSARQGELDGALLTTMDAIDRSMTAGGRDRLQTSRLINAVLGLGIAPVALLGTLAIGYLGWRRQGRDPFFLDSPSVLMAGPPANLTPVLATVVRDGRSTQRTVTTALMMLASQGWIAFRDADVPAKGNEGGPSVEVLPPPSHPRPLGRPEQYLLDVLTAMAADEGILDREALSRLHASIGDFDQLVEADAVRLGWFHEQPRRAIGRWMVVATVELVAGGAGLWLGISLPMGGATALGAALLIGGGVTLLFARAMSQRTPNGAMVDGMLKAYRRTLKLTLEQSSSMDEVVADETVHRLAATPDEALVWGIALGLHREVAALLERSLVSREASTGMGTSMGAWYPAWLGTSTSSLAGDGGPMVSHGGGGLFSASAVPNVAGMFSALGTIGSPPASSGGGFGGGSGGGGGGASGSF